MILIREEDREAAERKKKILLFLFIALACLYVAAALLLLLLSPDDYLPFLIADIVISIAFGWYAVYFFTVSYDYAVKNSRLLDKVLAALPHKEYGVYLREEEKKTIEGIEMRIFLFSVEDTEREVRVLNEGLSLEEGKTYELETHCGVLVVIGGINE